MKTLHDLVADKLEQVDLATRAALLRVPAGRIDQVMTDPVERRAAELVALGLKPLDALHAASAEATGANYFLTCDDRLARRYTGPQTILNPVSSILQLSESS